MNTFKKKELSLNSLIFFRKLISNTKTFDQRTKYILISSTHLKTHTIVNAAK